MKNTLLLIMIFFSFSANSQNVFEYEKEINNNEDYDFKEINFLNHDDNITISGTLIEPKLDYDKIIIIVPGSGKDTRNSHYVLAEALLKNNIAVFRFDERGIGKSQGNYSELANDLSKDLSFALQFIQKEYPNKKIGIIGHSLGGIATLQMIKDNVSPKFIVLIESPIIKNGSFIINQFNQDYENSLPDVMRKGKNKEEILLFLKGFIDVVNKVEKTSLKNELKNYIKQRGFNKKFIALLDDKFFIESITTNLEETLKQISLRTLYLTGTKNKIINYHDETTLIASFKNPEIEIEIFEGLNHYLTDRNGKVGSSLYNMDKEPLTLLINWITKQ